MDTISGSCEMNSQGGSFVMDFYHFMHFTVCLGFFPKSS